MKIITIITKINLIFILFLFFTNNTNARIVNLEKIEFNKNNDIIYKETTNLLNQNVKLSLDLYNLEKDYLDKSTLIVLAHGGGFIEGNKNDFEDYAEYLANNGYTVASINYRLIPKELHNQISPQMLSVVLLNSMEDMNSAIEYLLSKENYEKVIVGGYSAGALTALHLSYLNSINDIMLMKQHPVLGSMQGADDYIQAVILGPKSYKIDKVINIAGSLVDSRYVENGDPAAVSIHAKEDEVVPYSSGDTGGYGVITEGSELIHQQLNKYNIDNLLISIADEGHNVFESGEESDECKNCRNYVDAFLMN